MSQKKVYRCQECGYETDNDDEKMIREICVYIFVFNIYIRTIMINRVLK